MKVTWELPDIKSGTIVAPSNGASEKWMIGYFYPEKDKDKLFTMNSLSDGLVNCFETKQHLADHLNNNQYLPAVLVE